MHARASGHRLRLLVAIIRLDLEQQRDPWGTVYHAEFRITRDLGVLAFRSAGPDRIFGTADDFVVDEVSGPYFAEVHDLLTKLLAATKSFPQDESDWNRLLRSAESARIPLPFERGELRRIVLDTAAASR